MVSSSVCDKQESEEDEPGTFLSGDIGQNEGKEVKSNYIIKIKKSEILTCQEKLSMQMLV